MSFINLIVLRCADIERTRGFYECLGFEFERHRHGDGPEHLTAWDNWSIFLELYPASAKNPPDRIGLGVGVGSLEKTLALLKERGFEPDNIKAGNEGA